MSSEEFQRLILMHFAGRQLIQVIFYSGRSRGGRDSAYSGGGKWKSPRKPLAGGRGGTRIRNSLATKIRRYFEECVLTVTGLISSTEPNRSVELVEFIFLLLTICLPGDSVATVIRCKRGVLFC